MNLSKPAVVLKTRLSAILLGVSLLIWLSFEDQTENLAIIFAILLCAWLAGSLLLRANSPATLPLYYFILAGILAGAAVTPLAILLMAFKTGWHAHLIPDYTTQQILSIIKRTPIWIIGGFFIGSGFGIWLQSNQIRPEAYHAIER